MHAITNNLICFITSGISIYLGIIGEFSVANCCEYWRGAEGNMSQSSSSIAEILNMFDISLIQWRTHWITIIGIQFRRLFIRLINAVASLLLLVAYPLQPVLHVASRLCFLRKTLLVGWRHAVSIGRKVQEWCPGPR